MSKEKDSGEFYFSDVKTLLSNRNSKIKIAIDKSKLILYTINMMMKLSLGNHTTMRQEWLGALGTSILSNSYIQPAVKFDRMLSPGT